VPSFSRWGQDLRSAHGLLGRHLSMDTVDPICPARALLSASVVHSLMTRITQTLGRTDH